MHGAACFAGTRVTVQSLFDHLETGYTVDGYLAEFPTVKREQVLSLVRKKALNALDGVPNHFEFGKLDS
jgi:uncharacterized protein (DUF433 family)